MLNFFLIFPLKIENIDGELVKVSLTDGFGASEATFTFSYESDFTPFQIIANSIKDIFSDAILMLGTMVCRDEPCPLKFFIPQ